MARPLRIQFAGGPDSSSITTASAARGTPIPSTARLVMFSMILFCAAIWVSLSAPCRRSVERIAE